MHVCTLLIIVRFMLVCEYQDLWHGSHRKKAREGRGGHSAPPCLIEKNSFQVATETAKQRAASKTQQAQQQQQQQLLLLLLLLLLLWLLVSRHR
jgi:hypothetical protein